MRIFRSWLLIIILVVSFLPQPGAAQSVDSVAYVYKDGLSAGWNEWLWDTITADYKIAKPVYSGTLAMAIRPGRGWTAWNVINKAGLDISPYVYFTFAAQGAATSSWWEIQFLDANSSPVNPKETFKFQPGAAWKIYSIDLSQYAPSKGTIYGIRFWYVTSQPSSSTLYLDEVGFGGKAPAATPVRLRQQQTLAFAADAGRRVHPFNRHMLGVAHGNWDHSWGKQFPGQVPGLDAIYLGAQVGLIRYAGGLWANSAGWERSLQKTPYTEWHPVASRYYSGFQTRINTRNTYYFHYGMDEIDSLGALAARSGADVMIQVNLSQNDPSMWADLVRYTNVEKGYNFKYWELGNELDLECSKGEATCLNAATYQTRAAAYITAMKAVDQSIVIVGGVPASAHDIVANNWVNTPNLSRYLVSGLAAGADALSYHWYTDCNAANYENISTWSWTADTTAWQNAYSRSWSKIAPTRIISEIIAPTGKAIELGVTELNDDACDFNRAPQNGNQMTAVWYADVLGRLAYNGADFAVWYEGYGNGSASGFPAVAVDQDNPTRSSQIYLRPVFDTLFLYGNFFGDQMVQVTGPQPDTTSLWAARDSSDPTTLRLMATNLSSAQTTISVNITGFTAFSGTKYELTNPNPLDRTAASNGPDHGSTINGYKLLSTNISTARNQIPRRPVSISSNTVTVTLAPYSVTAIVLQSLASIPRAFLPILEN